MELAYRIVKPLFWAALVFAYGVAVMPAEEAPKIGSTDKIEHMLAFLTLSILAKLAYPRIGTVAIGLLLAGFGALIEFSQMIPSLHRDAELADWYADVAAIVVGLGLATLLLRARARLR